MNTESLPLYAGLNEIKTYTNIYVDVLNPQEDNLFIEDIARSLSMQCRFNGHLKKFYSVAQHCYLCSLFGIREEQFECLMHDSSEGYLSDVPTPVKRLLPDYYKIEDGFMKVLSRKFNFNYPLSASVKAIDKMMLEVEWDSIVIGNTGKILGYDLWSPEQAEEMFIKRFKELKR